MLASGSAVQKIPVSPERTKKEQKRRNYPPHNLPENVFMQTTDSDGKCTLWVNALRGLNPLDVNNPTTLLSRRFHVCGVSNPDMPCAVV